jgi:hypothetical protein
LKSSGGKTYGRHVVLGVLAPPELSDVGCRLRFDVGRRPKAIAIISDVGVVRPYDPS